MDAKEDKNKNKKKEQTCWCLAGNGKSAHQDNNQHLDEPIHKTFWTHIAIR